MKLRRRVIVASVVTAGSTAACGFFATPSFTGAAAADDGGAEGASQREGAATDDAANADGADTGPSLRASCALAEAGSPLVDAGSFCIDSLEVTQAQYAAFVRDVTASNRSFYPPTCAFKASLTPEGCDFDPSLTPDLPVTGVDWCDAYAYCRWAGKRLCGRIGGGAAAPAERLAGKESQWFAACSNFDDGQHTYPYGNTFVSAACVYNGNPVDGGGPLPVDASPACAGGVSPDLKDMSGNVSEWDDSCDPPDGAGVPGTDDICYTRGGDWNNGGTFNVACAHTVARGRDNTRCDVGFRCCADN